MAVLPRMARFLQRLRVSLRGAADQRDEIARPWLAATLCVLASLLIWSLLTLSDNQTAEIDVPIEVIGLPIGKALIEAPPARVRVSLRGEGFDLLELFYDRPSLPIQATDDRVEMSDLRFDLPGNVDILSFSPPVVELRSGESSTVRLPIRPTLDLSFNETYDVAGAIRMSPDSVTVTGASEIVERLAHWPTKRIGPYRRLTDTVEVTVELSDTLSNLVRLSAKEVDVVVPVGAFTGAERDVEVQVVGAPTSERVVTLDPPTVRLRFRVLLSHYSRAMDSQFIRATVDYDSLRADDTNFIRPTIQFPSSLVIRDLDVMPAVVGYFTVTAEE